jgi:hypothetical protein
MSWNDILALPQSSLAATDCPCHSEQMSAFPKMCSKHVMVEERQKGGDVRRWQQTLSILNRKLNSSRKTAQQAVAKVYDCPHGDDPIRHLAFSSQRISECNKERDADAGCECNAERQPTQGDQGSMTRAIRQYFRHRRRDFQRPDLLELRDGRRFRFAHTPHGRVIETLIVRDPAFGIAFANGLKAFSDDAGSRWFAKALTSLSRSANALGERKRRVG